MKALFLLIIVVLSFLDSFSQRITKHEKELIKSSSPSTYLYVTQSTIPNDLKILRANSFQISNPKRNIWEKLSKRMIATLQHPDHEGVGIAAPQVGINRRIVIVQRFDKEEKPFETIINPEILNSSDSLWKRIEGCLSIPEIRDTVERSWEITVKYSTLDGKIKQEVVSGFTARIFQHEIDHLNGVLFTDYIKPTNKE